MTSSSRILLALLASAAAGITPGFASPAAAQSASQDPASPPTLQAYRLAADDEIRLDGRLDEGVWSRAIPITDFRQQDPAEGGTPTERTEIRVAYDERSLFIGAMLYDSDPSGILGYQRRRDVGLGTDDRFMWILDTFLDGRTGYFFEINPAGLMGDGILGGRVNKAWDGIWEAQVQRGPDGWSAEIEIPFSTLNFDPQLDTWGINFQRTVRRKSEEILWSGWRRSEGLFRPIHAGRLTGLTGISQGVGLEVKPYTVGNWSSTPGSSAPGGSSATEADLGFDVTYNLTPSLRGAVTVNTDFAEVEVDQRRVNLTRFPLRFEERREFFLEGSGVYGFGGRSGASPYFSRRIGLVGGEPVPIRYGARLGGQAGIFELGVQHLRTGSGGGLGPEDFTVARAKASIFEQSTAGFIYTRRAAGGDAPGTNGGTAVRPEDRQTVGVDLDLNTSRFLGRYNAELEAFAAVVSDPVSGEWGSGGSEAPTGASGLSDRSARGIRIGFPNDVWSADAALRELGDDYDPAVGFVPRNGFRVFQPSVSWNPRPASISWIRRFSFGANWEYLTDLEGTLETRQEFFTLPSITFESGDELSVQGVRLFERLDRPFEIRDDVVVPAGRYLTWEWSLEGRTAGRRRVSAGAELSRGGFWSGDRTAMDASITVRPLPGWTFEATWERNDVDLPQGDFVTNLQRVSGSWDISPWASVTGNVQYDDVSEIVGLFTRARWIVRPGNDVFVVYTHNWRETALPGSGSGRPEETSFSTLSRGGAVKLTYAIRF